MEKIATPSVTKSILNSLHRRPKKSLGQNFLVDAAAAEQIVAACPDRQRLLTVEVGPGLGALSQLLADGRRLCLLELDAGLAAHLSEYFKDDPAVSVLTGDALKTDLNLLAADRGFEGYQLISNLPYHITTPLLQHLLQAGQNWDQLVLMLQKEAAERVLSGPLGLRLSYYAQVSVVCDVPRSCFYPVPAVDSRVISISKRPYKTQAADEKQLFSLTDAAFAQRRKTVANSLTNSGLWTKEQVTAALTQSLLDGSRRPDDMSLDDFITLSGLLAGK